MKDDPLIGQLVLQAILIACNAVFACAEIAVISMNDMKLAKMAAEGDKRAIRLAKLTSQPARFLATIQVAITLSGFLGSAFAADNFSERITQALVDAGTAIPIQTINAVSVILITLILSYLTLIFGELVPKRLAMKNAEKLALGMSGLISFISKAFAPLVALLTVSTNGVLRLLGVDPNQEDEKVTEEEIRMMVDVGSEKGTIEESEKEMIQNVFEFDDVSAGEILTHRKSVDLLWSDEGDEEWAKVIHESRHSYYPVLGEDGDDVIGILDAKTYFRLDDRSRETVMAQAVLPPYFVPETIKADDLFREMKRTRRHFVVVMDEYGGMCGIVTMNDLLEEIVGDLPEAGEEQLCLITPLEDGGYLMPGCVPLDAITDKLGVELPNDEYDTLNGLVFDAIGAIPEDGTTFELSAHGLDIRVLDVQDRLITKAEVRRDAAGSVDGQRE
jgi:putative hemolysin